MGQLKEVLDLAQNVLTKLQANGIHVTGSVVSPILGTLAVDAVITLGTPKVSVVKEGTLS